MMTIEALYEYQPKVLTFIKKRCNNCHDAEDLVQDAFIRSMNHLEKIEPTSAYPWLCTVVLNLWKDALLSKKPLKRGIVDNLMSRDNFFLDEGEDALVSIEEIKGYNYFDVTNRPHNLNVIDIPKMDHQFTDEVIKVLDTCTELERKIFELRYLHGYQYPDIRKELKIKPWQVKSSLHNIKLKLKENWKL